jgi:tetratricopeptide (TPR) repeat protein
LKKKLILPLALLLGIAAPAAPTSAAPLPPENDAFAGELAPFLPEFQVLIRTRTQDPQVLLRGADALLAKLPKDSAARGVVLLPRAGTLAAINRAPEAMQAIEESIRLLPGFSGPLYLASEIYSFAGQPGRGADYFLQASQIDPQIARRVDDYTLSSLLGRLAEGKDDARLGTLSERLLQIGWRNGSLVTSDRIVLAALDARLAAGDVHGARTLVPRLIAPSNVARLLTDKKYDALRDTASAHAGPRLANLWPAYLARAEADWRNHGRGLCAGIYATALAEAGADSKLITTFLPILGKPLDQSRDSGLIFVANPLASALARKGRWDEALQVFETGLQVWPDDGKAQALNLSGNRGRLLVLKGDFAAALAQLDSVIATAGRIGGEVNDAAVGAFHYHRACALHRLGRGREARNSEAVIARRGFSNPERTIGLQICRGDMPAAKRLLIQALENDENRSGALKLVQPIDERVTASDWAREVRNAWEALQRDPAVRAAASRHGHILLEPVNAAVRDADL